MTHIPRIHCHSAFKHYEMFHSHSSSYGSSIFNTTYNFNGGSICGGGFFGGLLGGLGMGLGAGLMNFLGGGLFGGMGMFGGGMGMFGSGMGMFGNGFPMMNWWGGSRTHTDGAGGKDKPKNDDKKCEDIDREKIVNLRDKVHDLGKKDEIKQTDIDALRSEIEAAKKASDENHKKTDDESYDQLLRDLADIKPKQKTEPVSDPNPNPVQPDPNDAVNVTLQFARHDGNLIKDANIKGSIVGVKMAADGKTPAGYIIDCNSSDADSKFKLKYEVTINNGIYNIRCISRTHSTEDCKKKLYTPADGIDFKKEGNLLVRVTNSDEPLVSEHQKDGYNQVIDYSAENESFNLPADYKKVENGEAEIDGKKVKINV